MSNDLAKRDKNDFDLFCDSDPNRDGGQTRDLLTDRHLGCPEDGLVAADLADVDPVGAGGGREHLCLVAEPGEGDGEVAVRHRAQHGDALAQPQVLAHAELVDGRGDCGVRTRARWMETN